MALFGFSSASATAAVATIGRVPTSEPYPSTEAGWRDRYELLRRAYEQGAYSDAEVRAEHLFAAMDDDGKEIDITRRLFGFYRFITDIDAAALISSKGLTLETEGGTAGLLAAGEAVWARSRVKARALDWARMTAATGDHWLEAVRTSATPPFRSRIVAYHADWCIPVYDEYGDQLVKLTVCFPYLEEPAPDLGALAGAPMHELRRVIDREVVEVWVDGKLQSRRPHNLGVVPAAHLRWSPWTAPEHSLPAPHGLDAALARLNSFAAQTGAIANRYADPKTVIKGARVGGQELGLFGRIISGVPADGDVKYLEAGAQALGPILDVMREVIAHVRETAPEFLFADSAAAESGTARSYRASALGLKIGGVRCHWLPALAEVTGMAVAMDDNALYDPARYPFEVEAGPIIDPHVDGEVQTLMLAAPYLRKRDVVRRLQALGIADDDVSVDDYLAELDDEKAVGGGPTLADPAGGATRSGTPANGSDMPGDGEDSVS